MQWSNKKSRIKRRDKQNKGTEWHDAFAWLPVSVTEYDYGNSIGYKRTAWLETVQRKIVHDGHEWAYIYKLKE